MTDNITYLVLIEQGKTEEDTVKLMSQFQQAGIIDLHEMNHGPYQGQIMLGLYSSLENAEKRQKMLGELGFVAFISERY